MWSFLPVSLLLGAVLALPNKPALNGHEPAGSRNNSKPSYGSSPACRRTTVAILGAGVAGLTAAEALHNQSINDFLIVEYNSEVGGRVKHTSFGPDNITIELGANWVQGLGSPGGPENPIWTLAKRANITNTYSNYSSILTYDETGYNDYAYLLDEFEDYYTTIAQDAGYILTQNLQDRSVRSGLMRTGWKPTSMDRTMKREAVEWWDWDWEYASLPEQSSQEFGITNYNTTFYQWSEENNLVFDRRGFSYVFSSQSERFLKQNDPRLLLNTIVTNITYSDHGVTIYNKDKTCIEASYAINTFSLGVHQHDVVTYKPPLPDWKTTAIASFTMATYTKIFLQFPTTFWDASTQFFLYADPTTRGYFPIWQSLSTPGFLPGSNILFVTVVDTISYRVERQTNAQTQAEVMTVLRKMFPNTTVPDPVAILYPRWSLEPWAYGSYSNWPPATTLEMHQNLRANVGRMFYAGEHTSATYFGFLHGAYYEGLEAGRRIAGMIDAGKCVNPRFVNAGMGGVSPAGVDCGNEAYYNDLHGTTAVKEFASVNGWDASSFLTYGLTS